jgi:hypothetical protein
LPSSSVSLDWKEIETDRKFTASLLPFSQPSEWDSLEAKYQLLLRHGKNISGHIVSLPNLTEIQESHDKDDDDEQ